MPFITVNNSKIYYELSGKGTHTVVLIHGFVGSNCWWDPLWPLLTESLQVLRLDLPGCGKSDSSAEGFSALQCSSDIRCLLDELKLENVILVGHSLGAAIIMDMVTKDPDRYAGQVLIGPYPLDGIPEEANPKSRLEKLLTERDFMKLALSAVMPTACSGDFFESLVDGGMKTSPKWLAHVQSVSYREPFKNIRIPTRLMRGEKDSMISKEVLELTQQGIHGSQILTYEGVGHSPNIECPERVAEDINKFSRVLFDSIKPS